MGSWRTELECPQCKTVYTIYPLPEEFRHIVQIRRLLMEYDFCETKLEFEPFPYEKKQAYF